MVTKTYSVLLDTNILMSKTLRDWILLLALESKYEFFTPHVSSGIMDEFGYHVRRDNPSMNDAKIETWKQQICSLVNHRSQVFRLNQLLTFLTKTTCTCMPPPNTAACTP